MSKDKAEEKANNAQLFLIENKLNDLVISPLWCKDKVYVSDTLMEYTDSLSTENAQLIDALRELVDQIDEIGINRAVDYANGSRYYRCMISDESYEKAKQLLTDKE